MMNSIQPHDLLWGITQQMLGHDIPQWVIAAVSLGHPVVVRRDVMINQMIPVGIRGRSRGERFATHLHYNAITKCVQPEQLAHVDLNLFPHLKDRLEQINILMHQSGWAWGYTGSVGFELATGLKTVRPQSDIDLIIRTPEAMCKKQATWLLEQLDQLALKIDVQLQTPRGGVALKEWARATGKVLLKQSNAAVLTENPWQ
ncbi:malonate decarboxylase holo-ACP synthase [Acinetobacter soli]|uniref:malonate decarboxylase holo-ACP synthase n=1 Tax=Acinetobacter soli TaxID=487316 RepID=UPI001250552B|nr:malonate decarboxylase holo-ACP synthase [Acinetobacter soli]